MNRRALLRALVALPLVCAPALRLVCFGDSITAGQGASRPARAYVAVVGAALGRRVDNRAIGASRLAEQLDALHATPVLPGDIVLLVTGYNDMRAGTPLADYRRQLDAALGQLVAASAQVVVGGCLPMTPAGYAAYGPTWNHGSDAAAATYTAIIADVAAAHGCRFAPMDSYDPRNVTSDLVHPNDAGHTQIAQAMLRALRLRLYIPLVAQTL